MTIEPQSPGPTNTVEGPRIGAPDRMRSSSGQPVSTTPDPLAAEDLEALVIEALAWGGPTLSQQAVSVIIPTTGGPRCHRCVDALRQAAGQVPLQIILVVTGSRNLDLPRADKVVHCEEPFVWAKANNAGLRAALHAYVLLLNDDCYFTRPGGLEALVGRLQGWSPLMAVAPIGPGFSGSFDQGRLQAGQGVCEVSYSLKGACVLIRSEAFWVVGGFDERFVRYGCDEVDWFFRASRCGYRWGVDTDVIVHHEDGVTFGEGRRSRELPSSRQTFKEIHGVSAGPGPHWVPARPVVSWLIASHNNAGFLARCLGSIAANRDSLPTDFEVVLGLDGCTDTSAQVAMDYNSSLAEPLPLRLISFPEPAGTAGRALNRVIRLAKGHILLPMDDDDATTAGRGRLVV